MQEPLFGHSAIGDADEIEETSDVDPYEDARRAGKRLADEFGIDDERATDMVLSFGSEGAACRVLAQRWLLGEGHSRAA